METDDRSERILVIEDDPDTRMNLCDILEIDDFQVESAASLREATEGRSLAEAAVILLDRRLPDGNALDFLPRLRALAPEAALVVITGYSDLEGAIEAIRHGASDYILKPIDPDSLRVRIGRLVKQRQLARAKERSESAFRMLVEAADSLIVMLRPNNFGILYMSPFAEQLTGYKTAEVTDRSFLDLLVPEPDRNHEAERLLRVQRGAAEREYQGKIIRRDGFTRIMLSNARYLPDYDGAPAILVVGHDISALKQAEERVLHAERMAAIGQMCAGLAHESRNALQRSQACLEMLALKLEDRPDTLNLIGRIQQAQDDLHRLYEDVREYAAPIRLAPRMCRLDAIWNRAWSHLEPLRRGREATLEDHKGGHELDCEADEFRLEQVFRNILDNSLAASPGSVQVVIRATPSRLDDRPALKVAIRDNGPGLDAEQREKIFESFYTTKTRGTGLGMAIVKRIVEAHGGRVEVAEHTGSGAEIVLTLPKKQGR